MAARWITDVASRSASATTAGSPASPVTTRSARISATGSRIRAVTGTPRRASRSSTAVPTRPAAPVTRTRSGMAATYPKRGRASGGSVVERLGQVGAQPVEVDVLLGQDQRGQAAVLAQDAEH